MLVNCAGTQLKDFPTCIELNPIKGYCVQAVSGKSFFIDNEHPFEGKTWWENRPIMIQLPPSSWVNIKEFVIKICKTYKNLCDKEVSSWNRSIQTIDETVKLKQ